MNPLIHIAPIAAILALAGAPATEAALEACLKNHYILAEPCTQDWQPVNDGLDNRDVYVVAVDPKRTTTLYAGVPNRLFKSVDAGAAWSATLFIEPDIAGDLRIVTHVAIDTTDPATLHVGTFFRQGVSNGRHAIFKSRDGGGSWTENSYPATGGVDEVYSLALAPSDPATIYFAIDGYLGNNSAPFVRSTDRGSTWTYRVAAPLFVALAVDPLDSRTLYGGTFPLGINPANDPAAWLMGHGILKSRDGGETWNATGLTSGGVSALVVDPRNPRTLYAGTWGNTKGFQDVLKSVDGGATWSSASNGLGQFVGRRGSNVATIAIDSNDSNTLYLVMRPDGGVFRSFDAGATWSPFNDGLPGEVRSVALATGDRNTLYAGTREGVFRITDVLPALFLDAPRLCLGSPWSVALSRGEPDAPARLYGTVNGEPWESDWYATNATGRISESGVFGVEGVHTLRVRVGGALSNSIRFEVTECQS